MKELLPEGAARGGATSAEETRQTIIDAALRLFGERGYHATSLQDIIDAAGCSKGAFYHHFNAKEDLVLLFHDTFIDHLLLYAEEREDAQGAPLGRLQDVLRHLLYSLSTFRNHMAVFNNESRFLTQENFALVKSKRDRYEAAVVALVREAQANGDLRPDLNPKLFTFALLGTFNWAFRWFHPGQPLTTDEMAKTLFGMLVEGGQPR